MLATLYKLLAWQAAGNKGNQCFFVASDLGQAEDALDLSKKLIFANPVLANELEIYRNVVHRKDGKGFSEILPSQNADTLHGKTYLFYGHSELHTQKDYRVLEGLELDRTRPDATQWFESYAAVSPAPGQPINDILKQHQAQSDPRLYASWYSGTIEEANPSLNGPLGPTMEDILDAQRALPSWIFRRLYQNLPGQPDNAAYDAEIVQRRVVTGRSELPPVVGTTYQAFSDLSGGGADDATLAVAHHEQGRVVLDLLIDQGPRRAGHTFSPQDTVSKFADALKHYGVWSVTGDRYAAQWPVLAFQQLGITYRPAAQNRSQLYAALEPLLNSGQVELLDQPKLIGQLIGLVRKGEKIDHLASEHDDHSNAAAGALVLASAQSVPWEFHCAGRSLSSAPMVEQPSLVSRATAAIGRGVETITARLSSVVDTTTEAAEVVAQALTPAPSPAELRRIESLSEGVRTPDEQKALDAHYERRARTRQLNGFEQSVLDAGVYWPNDHVRRFQFGSNIGDAAQDVKAVFDQWR